MSSNLHLIICDGIPRCKCEVAPTPGWVGWGGRVEAVGKATGMEGMYGTSGGQQGADALPFCRSLVIPAVLGSQTAVCHLFSIPVTCLGHLASGPNTMCCDLEIVIYLPWASDSSSVK